MAGITPDMEILQKENEELLQRVIELENLVSNVSVPIIPSVIPGVILIPIAGEVSSKRFDLIIPTILDRAAGGDIDSVILDFSAISVRNSSDLAVLGTYLRQLSASLNLVGVQVLIAGITPQFAQELVMSQMDFIKEVNTFASFRTALHYLMKEKGLALNFVTN